MILCLLMLNIAYGCDSLEKAFDQDPRIETLLELSRCHVAEQEFHMSMEVLKTHGARFDDDTAKALIMYETGSVYMFSGDIVKAHETFLRLISGYAAFDVANDAADRLYLIESARDDTIQLKRLINVVRLFETGQHARASDSAKGLLNTAVGPQAYYYLALAYREMGDLPQCLGPLAEMKKEYPAHALRGAVLLEAEIPPSIARGFNLIARCAGLVGHLLEEQTEPAGYSIWHAAEQAIPYEAP